MIDGIVILLLGVGFSIGVLFSIIAIAISENQKGER